MSKCFKKYILWFAQEHVNFRLAEFNSLVKLLNLKYTNCNQDPVKPFWIVEFPDDETALKFASRSILLRAVYELWSYGCNAHSFHFNLKQSLLNYDDSTLGIFEENFKIIVEAYNKHFSQNEKVAKIESLDYLPLTGQVDLKTPKIIWWYMEFWGLDPRNVPKQPECILFGRWLGNGKRHLINELSLKKRKFIGNTSMDAQLSLLMANQALIKTGDLVFDPFVGTGSLLVSAAKFGAYVLGADIDFMILHARGRPSRITQKVRDRDESIRSNLEQYNCGKHYLDVVVADFSNSLWDERLQFDSIITDPPYGIREATEKVQTKCKIKETTKKDNMPHYPSTSHYALHHLYKDLLIFASRHLKIGGRLVFWLPVHRDDYTDKMLPRHANLILISNSEQILTGQTCRRLLTYEKYTNVHEHTAFDECIMAEESITALDFRERYFNNDAANRSERRERKVELKELGRLEALKRGKIIGDGRSIKCDLNINRFK